MQNSVVSTTASEYITALAGPSSVPGGGGAAALCGALGAALGAMAASLTKGKKKFAEHAERLEQIQNEMTQYAAELVALADADAEAFAPLAEAYKLPADYPDRADILERGLNAAAAVPMKLLELSVRALAVQRELLDRCSVLVISDVGVGAAACRAAAGGALLNVRANTRLMQNKEAAAQLDEKSRQLARQAFEQADYIYNTVVERLG